MWDRTESWLERRKMLTDKSTLENQGERGLGFNPLPNIEGGAGVGIATQSCTASFWARPCQTRDASLLN